MTEPATEKQVNYLRVLADKLRALTEDQDEIADRIEEASASVLSKKDASDLIEALIASVKALGGEVEKKKAPKGTPTKQVRDPNVVAAERERVERWEAINKLNAELIKRHGGTGRKPAPAGNAPMKVWHERPDYHTGQYWSPIHYGWVWECRHPDHKARNGKDGVVRGGSQLGRDVTIENAKIHWRKYHRQEKES